ncbi:GAF domain-containing protein [Aureibacillus halotolerans]|nr:GAF domain-containing protein [Aureibacillus halotolerans]
MEKFLIEVLNRSPDWVFHITSIFMVALVALLVWWAGIGAKRFADALGRENRLISIQEELLDMQKQATQAEATTQQLRTTVDHMSSHLKNLQQLRLSEYDSIEDVETTAHALLQRIVESLAADIKFKAGDAHRCGLWLSDIDARRLVLFKGSHGFPTASIQSRTLDIDKSVAGLSFRRGEPLLDNNVKHHSDWAVNPHSSSKYKTMVSIPMTHWGVLTIDGRHDMTEDTIRIGEVYASVMDVILSEYMLALHTSDDEYESM